MDLRQLNCFVAIAEAGNFRRAAMRIRIPQPTVTQAIQRLEREVGHPLFDRSTRPISLTSAGGRLLPEARRVLAGVREALCAARGETAGPERVMRLGTAGEMGLRLARLLRGIRDTRPEYRVELHAEPVETRLRMVRDGELDAAFVRVCEEYPGLHLVRVWSDELAIAVSTANPLSAQPVVRWDQLKNLPLRLVAREVDPLLRGAVVGACEAAGFSPVLGRPVTTEEDTLVELGLDPVSWTVVHPAARHAVGALVAHRPVRPALVVPVSLAVRDTGEERARVLLAACLGGAAGTRDQFGLVSAGADAEADTAGGDDPAA